MSQFEVRDRVLKNKKGKVKVTELTLESMIENDTIVMPLGCQSSRKIYIYTRTIKGRIVGGN